MWFDEFLDILYNLFIFLNEESWQTIKRKMTRKLRK